MGLLDRIFHPEKDKEAQKALDHAEAYFDALTVYRPVFTSWKGAIYESQLVRAAIDARARHISKLKVEIRGSAQPALQARLRLGPNEWQTYSQFLYRTSTILDVQNTAFVVPVMDDRLVTTGYFTVLPNRCEIVQYKGEPWLRYTFTNGGKAAVELQRCAILTKFQYKNDFFGEHNDEALDETMQLIHIQAQGIQTAVKNTAGYSFMAKVSNWSKPDDLARERQRFTRENLSSEAEDGGVLLFPNTYSEISQIKYNPYTPDAEQMKLIRESVHDYFGTNDKIMRNEATGEDLDAFFNGAVEPFSIQFSEVMTKATFTERERVHGSCWIASANRLQYMSTSAKVSLAKELGDRGAIMIDEIRELFNYPPLPDGMGQRAPIRGEYYYSTDEKEKGGADDAKE